MNSPDFRTQTSPYQIKNRTKSEIFIVKPNQQGKNIQIRTQHSPMQQHTKRSQTSLIVINKDSSPTASYRSSLTRDQLRLVNEDLFDQFMENSINKPLNQAFESIAKQMFQCDKCILWIDIPDEKYLYSPTYNLKAGYDNTLPGFIFRTKSLIQVRDPSNAPNGFKSDMKLVPPKSPQLFFALTSNDISRAVVQVIQKPNAPCFTRTDNETANLIISKFSIYGNSIFTSRNVSEIAQNLYSSNLTQINPIDIIIKHFGCDICELWKFDTVRNLGQRVIDVAQKDPPINIENCGIVGNSILNNRPINLSNATEDKSYQSSVDGKVHGPVLVVTTDPGARDIWAIVLRGRKTRFSATEEVQLRSLLPFIVGTFVGFNSNDEQSTFTQQLSELLKTAETLTSKVSNANFFRVIQDETIKTIECQCCLLFLLSDDKKLIIGHYKNKLIKRFPFGKGICSYVIQTGQTVSLLNPTEFDHFDSQIDSENFSVNNVAPTSILSAPIRNIKGEIIGCLELLSKSGDDRFTENDQKVLSALNVFVGICIENTRNYTQAANLSKKLRAFMEMLLHTNKESDLLPLLEDILDTSKEFMHAQRVSFFISDGTQLSLFLNVGESNKYGTIFSDIAKEKREMTTFSEDQIIDLMKVDSKSGETENRQQNSDKKFSKISQIFSENNEFDSSIVQEKNESLCCIPLFNHEGSVVGVLETMFTDIFLDENIELIDSFASIASLSLDRLNLKQMAPLGYGPLDVNDWLSEEEKTSTTEVPLKFSMEDNIFTSSFEIEKYDGIELFKIIFQIFHKFELLKTFHITNQVLFNFIDTVRNKCSKTPQHNWNHAVDTLQFVASQIIEGKLIENSKIGHFEQLALFVSSLVHDVDHQWFRDEESNEDSKNDDSDDDFDFEFEFGQTSDESQISIPLNILMKKQSLLETHHVEAAIDIITSKPEANIFLNLNDQDYDEIWSILIELILAKDMRKHFKIVQKLKASLNSDNFNPMTDKNDRLLLMKCLLKTADLSKIVRPFNDSKNCLANWNVSIAEEFFRQADLDETQGMVFISSNKDYTHLDKDASLFGFFNSVCIPLFQVVSVAVPLLKENANTLKDNIQKWAKKTGRVIPNF